MKCVYCNEKFYLKRSILDLFKIDKEYICNKCYKKYKLDITVETIQLEKYDLTVVSMFKKKYYINLNYFYKEYTKLFNTLSKRLDSEVIFLDEISLSDYNLYILDGITKLFKKNLIVLVFNIKY